MEQVLMPQEADHESVDLESQEERDLGRACLSLQVFWESRCQPESLALASLKSESKLEKELRMWKFLFRKIGEANPTSLQEAKQYIHSLTV